MGVSHHMQARESFSIKWQITILILVRVLTQVGQPCTTLEEMKHGLLPALGWKSSRRLVS